MEESIKQIALQVPVTIAGMGIIGYIFIQITKMLLDLHGKKLDRLADAFESLVAEVKGARRR